MLQKTPAALFMLALALLPAAEWRSIVLPINDKPLGFDPVGQASASPFDLVFLLFCVSLIPDGIRFLRARALLSPWLVHWWAGFVLLGVMLATNDYALPFLTPAVRKVLDARSLLLHLGVMVAVAIYVSRLRPETVVRGVLVFCAASAAGLAVLCALAIAEVPLFRFRYPFTNPTHIAFPFPTYNMASGFIAVACLGLIGAAQSLRKPFAILLCVPVFLLASALTGSRSGLFVLIVALVAFAGLILFPALRRAANLAGMRRSGLTVAAVIGIAASMLAIGYDWQPIRRAVSIFQDVAANPAVLLMGQPGSPRHEMWQLARTKARMGSIDENRDYSVVLTSIEGGCVRESSPIRGLQPKRDYWVRLRQTVSKGVSLTTVGVFRDPLLTDLVGLTALEHASRPLANFSMYLSDTGGRYVVQSGRIEAFGLAVDGQPVRYAADRIITYFDPLNGAPGKPVVLHSEKVEISAKDRKIRGFINWTTRVPQPSRELVFEYRLALDRVTYTLPLDAPAMFYVGLHDTDAASSEKNWMYVQNGLLIQHRRETSNYEQDVLVKHDAEEAWARLGGANTPEQRSRFERLMKERRCAATGSYKVADIWKARYSTVEINFNDIYNAKVAHGSGLEGISVLSDPTWSARRHLQDGGSTHNVYLDWFYYERPPALAMFLVFALSLGAVSFLAASRTRGTPYNAFAWAVHLQVIAILLMMYAQPYIWVKYYWVVFGVASALAINGDARRRAS